MRKRRVLVVDDYDDSRDALVAGLTAAGFVARGVEEEAATAAAAEFEPHVVILDLPIVDLVEIAGSLRATGAKIVALVDRTEPRRSDARAAGVDFFVLRPCAPRDVAAVCRRLTK